MTQQMDARTQPVAEPDVPGVLLEQYAGIAAHLAVRRDHIMESWRQAVRRDPALTSGNSMPRSELNDHIPVMLSAFERSLRLRGGGFEERQEGSTPQDAAAHGLHRWQQGYDLREVTLELGRLNECMVVELNDYERSAPGVAAEVLAEARRIWAEACTEGVAASAAQYYRLQQLEAEGHVVELENALAEVRELERQRAELWQEVAHDLRGNLGVVANATAGLVSGQVPASSQERYLSLLQRNVTSLHHLLDDVTSLARLQAGREVRHVETVDVAVVLQELFDGLKPLAEQKGLFLRHEGEASLVVDADAVKLRRLAQNLLLNAIKFTSFGGVLIGWGSSDGDDPARWALTIRDTGPGLQPGRQASMAGALEAATNLIEGSTPSGLREITDPTNPVESAGTAAEAAGHSPGQAPGEGLGLSIVKRLCEILDATIEFGSNEGCGTTFRILLPRQYT